MRANKSKRAGEIEHSSEQNSVSCHPLSEYLILTTDNNGGIKLYDTRIAFGGGAYEKGRVMKVLK